MLHLILLLFISPNSRFVAFPFPMSFSTTFSVSDWGLCQLPWEFSWAVLGQIFSLFSALNCLVYMESTFSLLPSPFSVPDKMKAEAQCTCEAFRDLSRAIFYHLLWTEPGAFFNDLYGTCEILPPPWPAPSWPFDTGGQIHGYGVTPAK